MLDEKGYCMDYTIAQIYEKHGKEPNLCQAETYKTQWKRFKIDKMNFGNKEIKEKEKYRNKHLIKVAGYDGFFRVGKDFFESLPKKLTQN